MIEQVETSEQAKARGASSVSSEYSHFFLLACAKNNHASIHVAFSTHT